MVRVVHGVDFEEADLAGRTLAEVRTAYRNTFNIGEGAVAKVNGKEAGPDHVVKDGDKVSFEKTADKYEGEGEASASPSA